jgi:hypothetical protein
MYTAAAAAHTKASFVLERINQSFEPSPLARTSIAQISSNLRWRRNIFTTKDIS